MKATTKLLILKPKGASTPTAITATSGSGQSANCGAAYTNPLVATITPPLAGIAVTFTAPASGASGTFASTLTNTETVVTNSSGVATSSAFTANTVAGANFTVTATAGALSCNFTLTNVETYANYVVSTIAPVTPVVGWYRLRETSGAVAVNSGSGGAALNAANTAATVGQTGRLGANEAYALNGTTSQLQIANNAALAGLTKWEIVFLVNPTNAGESNFGVFFSWGNGGAPDREPFFVFNGALTSIWVELWNTAPTLFDTKTLTGLAASTWKMIFAAYDDGGDRKVHLFAGDAGGVTEFGYAIQTAMTGTYKAPILPLNLFNNTNQANTFNGLGDEVLVISGNLAAGTRTQLAALAFP